MQLARPSHLLAGCGVAVATVLLLAGCAGSPAPYSPVSPLLNSSVAGPPAGDAVVRAWGRGLMRVPLPGAGCFKASYPAGAWTRIECAKPMHLPLPRTGKINPLTIGNGKDYALSVSPHIIKTAIGSFPKLIGVKRVKTVAVPPGKTCLCGNGSYTLQLNTDFYGLAPCAGNAKCTGWEQLVFENPPTSSRYSSLLYIQDWRIKGSGLALKCPPKSTGWQAYGGDCYYSTEGVAIPPISIKQLDKLSVSLGASTSGNSAFLTLGTTIYGLKHTQADFMKLSRNWSGAELNIFGDCCASQAVFNPGSTIRVRLEADDGSTAAPVCVGDGGTTGETNNLSFIAAPANAPQQEYPSILFAQSNAGGGGTASCAALAGL